MKRILVVCQHFWPEAFRINDLASFLVEKGCQVEVLCGIPNYPHGRFFPGYSIWKNRRQFWEGVEIHRAWEIPRGGASNLRVFWNYISFPFCS
ncbi:MAG TPA: glycosyltransferase WbuB, partial [Candidatus Aminicenantes bacterium]|nr:glycosyltransferase WbuB [Candidatus Aminicenantes bacterium]